MDTFRFLSLLLLLSLLAQHDLVAGFRCSSVHHAPISIIKSKIMVHRIHQKTHAQLRMSDQEEEDNEGYTRKQIIKEEIEAPFRKVRFFGIAALFAAASIGTLVSLSQLLAISLGRTGSLNEMEVYQNLAINLGGLPILGLLWKRDKDAQDSLLERIQKGGKLAGLRLKLNQNGEQMIVKLSDLRRDRGIEKRVVIVAAPKTLLRESLASSMEESKNMVSNDLIIAPLVIEELEGSEYTLTATSMEAMIPDIPNLTQYEHLGLPLVLASWNNVIKKELSAAIKQTPEALKKGVTIIIKKNGKVGSRRLGVPIWSSLAADVSERAELGLDVTNI